MSKRYIIVLVSFLALTVLVSFCTPSSSRSARNDKAINLVSSDCVAINDPDGSDFKWDLITQNDISERCLLQLAHNFVDASLMAEWLERQGFLLVEVYTRFDSTIYVNAVWDVKKSVKQPPFHSSRPYLERLFYEGRMFSVQVTYEGGIPTRSNAGYLVL